MNTTFPAPIKRGRSLAHVRRMIERTDLVAGGRRIRTTWRSTAFPAPIKRGKGLARVTRTNERRQDLSLLFKKRQTQVLSRPYVKTGAKYDEYRDAYRYGWESRATSQPRARA